jgi:Tol biopolymer transport system component
MLAIYSVESGETRELALPVECIFQPRWSTDGNALLAIGKDGEGRRGAFSIDAQTGAVSVIPGTDFFMRPPVWTRDATGIIYGGYDGAAASWVIRARNLETRQEQELSRGMSVNDLALSPDGKQLAFAAHRALFLMPAGGGEPRELLRVEQPERERLTSLAWMPDGQHLLFARLKLDSTAPRKRTTEVWRISASGGEPEQVGIAMDRLRGLRVHPDGQRIAFTAGAPEMEIWVMDNFLPTAQTAKDSPPRR